MKLYTQFIYIQLILILIYDIINSYKLNVPKILLPFYSSKITNFTLEAKHDLEPGTDDLCFVWSSSRPDLVSITPIYEKRNVKFNGYDCSHRAVVSALSKHSQRMTSIIFAKEIITDKIIRCDVIVDRIHSIRIKHTTTHLYLEDSPESLTAVAVDFEMNTFTSIDGLAFEWKVLNDETESDDSRNVLKISNFLHSEYETSDSIKQLETLGLHGHKILIEGQKTGSASVQAKLIDPFYKDGLKTPPVRLMVVANILIEPSYPIYLLMGTSIRYNVYLIKQTSVEKIALPSSQYYFESENVTIAHFDKTGSLLITNELGSSQIFLIDRNMHEKFFKEQDIGLKPSAFVHVVQADNFKFSVKNWPSWSFEAGREYQIEIQLYTKDNNLIYPSDNLKIESQFEKVFSIREKSQNGSYVLVKALERSVSVIKAFLPDGTVRGQQQIEIFDPISIRPQNLVLAYSANEHHYYKHLMNVFGGSGAYFFQLKDSSAVKLDAKIDPNGLLKVNANRLGESTILVNDQRNFDIKSQSKVMVIEPTSLYLEPCPVETLVRSRLEIKIKMNGLTQNGLMVPIMHCSALNFKVLFQDETIFRHVEVYDFQGDDQICAVIALDALKIGKTIVQVVYGEIKSQEMIIYSLSELTSHKKSLLLTKSSSYLISLFDGPFLNSDMHSYLSEANSDSNLLNVEHLEHDSLSAKNTYRLTCLDTSNFENQVVFTVWNKPHKQNKCPIKFSFKLAVKCGVPKSLDLYHLFVKNEDSDQQVYADLKWNCPIKLASRLAVANMQRDLNVQIMVRDENERQFDNFTSLRSEWKINSIFMHKPREKIKFLNVRPLDENSLALDTNDAHFTLFYKRFEPKKVSGLTEIELKLYINDKAYLESFLNIRFVNDVQIEPKQLVLFNHPFNMQKLNLVHGSGYFHGQVESEDKNLLRINRIWDSGLEVSPLINNGVCYVNVFDYCVPPEEFISMPNELCWKPTARSSVTIAGINSIMVSLEQDKVLEGQQTKFFVQIVDANGNYIQSSYFKLMNLQAKVVDGDLSMLKIEPSNQMVESDTTKVFMLTGLKSGFVKIRFEAQSDSEIIKSQEKLIEIYAPIRVEPKMVELVPGTEYQIKYTGGPELSHDIKIIFEILDDDKLLELNQNGLVKALQLGICRVRVQFNNSIKLYTQELVEFKIVDPKFVTIRSPLDSIKSGNKFPLHLHINNLNPFYFGTSKLIQYKWTLNDNALAEIINNDGFSIHVKTKRAGLLKISVSVLYGDRELIDSKEVNIFFPAAFSNFESITSTGNVILASSFTTIQLRTNYDLISSKIIYDLEFGTKQNNCSSSDIKISEQGLLSVSDVKSECSVQLKLSIYLDTKVQIIYHVVKIKEISYQMLNMNGQSISVSYHDNLGDEFYVLNTKNSLLTNRNDLISIFFLNQNIFGTGERKSFFASENSLNLVKLNDGFLLMEIHSDNFNDYIGFETNLLSKKVRKVYIGDLVLNLTEPSNSIIKSVKTECALCPKDSYIGIAYEPGSITLDNNKDYFVHNLDRVYFLSNFFVHF